MWADRHTERDIHMDSHAVAVSSTMQSIHTTHIHADRHRKTDTEKHINTHANTHPRAQSKTHMHDTHLMQYDVIGEALDGFAYLVHLVEILLGTGRLHPREEKEINRIDKGRNRMDEGRNRIDKGQKEKKLEGVGVNRRRGEKERRRGQGIM